MSLHNLHRHFDKLLWLIWVFVYVLCSENEYHLNLIYMSRCKLVLMSNIHGMPAKDDILLFIRINCHNVFCVKIILPGWCQGPWIMEYNCSYDHLLNTKDSSTNQQHTGPVYCFYILVTVTDRVGTHTPCQ